VFGGSKVQKTKKAGGCCLPLDVCYSCPNCIPYKKNNGAFGITDQLFLEKIQTSAS
jgi:hypothetical protein